MENDGCPRSFPPRNQTAMKINGSAMGEQSHCLLIYLTTLTLT